MGQLQRLFATAWREKIRLQAGWAKCERVPGVYDWKWLDEIINYAVANNIEPWLQTSYGNPAYPGGGGVNLLNSIMTTEEAWAAWDRWVEALVTRYKDRVKEWEIWNEPDHPGQKITPETTAHLNIRTAEIIKRIQPEAKIAGLAYTSNSDKVYLDKFLKVIADAGKLDLFHWISYHSYTMRPEDAYSEKSVLGLRTVIKNIQKISCCDKEKTALRQLTFPVLLCRNITGQNIHRPNTTCAGCWAIWGTTLKHRFLPSSTFITTGAIAQF